MEAPAANDVILSVRDLVTTFDTDAGRPLHVAPGRAAQERPLPAVHPGGVIVDDLLDLGR